MADDAEVIAARFQWDDGLRRLEGASRDGAHRARLRVLDACTDELRRRLGMTFTVSQLADVYRDASAWFLPLAAEIAPRSPEAWDPACVMDAAFAVFARQASDAGRRTV